MSRDSLPEDPAVRPHAAPVVWLHWSTFACIATAFAAILARSLFDDDGVRAVLLLVHRQAGLTALALTLLRTVVRAAATRAGTGADRGWALWIARAVHGLLYLALLAVPVLGWMLSDSRGQHPALWGLLPMPGLAAVDPDAADLFEDRHALVAWTFGALIVAHVAAALWHHWVLRDGVLRAMAPAGLARSAVEALSASSSTSTSSSSTPTPQSRAR